MTALPVVSGRAVFVGLVVLQCVTLSGCSGGFHSDTPATQVYVLRAVPAGDSLADRSVAPPAHADPAQSSPSLHVSRPIAGPGLASDHILLVQSGHRMNYYVASRWPADLPSVVEGLAVDVLRASGSWSAVQDSNSAFSSDYLLQMVIRRFEADYSRGSGPPEVHVVLDCTLGRRAGREIVASFVAEGSAVAAANRLTEVVAAFEDASNKTLDEIAARSAQAVKSFQKVEAPVPSITR